LGKLEIEMITVRLKGGLGNQMFQYARGRSLSLEKKEGLCLNLHDLEFPEPGDTRRKFCLDNFNIQAKITIPDKSDRFSRFLHQIRTRISGDDGFYQSEKYFKNVEDVIRRDFTLRNTMSEAAQKSATEINAVENPVSIHIRRGDYVTNTETNAHHGVCSLDYYERAIGYMGEKISSPVFFIFSDDIDWVKENLKLENAVYVSRPDIPDHEELTMMSRCKHHIIANSSFSWWGAWLDPNKDKAVIAPERWFADKKTDSKDIVPEGWIKL
jgi:hypothetical protein